MKKRLIRIKDITKAYSQEEDKAKLDLAIDSPMEDVTKLPKEIFEILGQVLSFVETTNKIEGDKNENKQ